MTQRANWHISSCPAALRVFVFYNRRWGWIYEQFVRFKQTFIRKSGFNGCSALLDMTWQRGDKIKGPFSWVEFSHENVIWVKSSETYGKPNERHTVNTHWQVGNSSLPPPLSTPSIFLFNGFIPRFMNRNIANCRHFYILGLSICGKHT